MTSLAGSVPRGDVSHSPGLFGAHPGRTFLDTGAVILSGTAVLSDTQFGRDIHGSVRGEEIPVQTVRLGPQP